jgi:NAD(P)-dependent dehydrogenase (short-subunit alcohol dehydrogenase family)
VNSLTDKTALVTGASCGTGRATAQALARVRCTGELDCGLRIQDGILFEHWDVIQDEATEEQSKSKAPMFGNTFPPDKPTHP